MRYENKYFHVLIIQPIFHEKAYFHENDWSLALGYCFDNYLMPENIGTD